MRGKLFVVIVLLCVLICLLGPAADASGYRQAKRGAKSVANALVPCDVGAYVIDQDPQGLNVRSGPGKNFDVIGNLPRKEAKWRMGAHRFGC